MNKIVNILFTVWLLLCPIISGSAVEKVAMMSQQDRVKWFEDTRLGTMIHWSLCTPAAGRFNGEVLRNSTYAEWLRLHNKVQRADWDQMAKRMPITEEAIEDWVVTTKRGGFKYLTFVTKHHDGVAFWNSKVSDYTYGNLSGTHFDVLKCLKEKCDKHGIILCAYYSHWLDWGDENGTNNDWDYADGNKPGFDLDAAGRGEIDAPFRKLPTREQYDKYWREKAMPQVAELIKDYGIKLLWFDCWRKDPVKETPMTQKQLDDMLSMIRSLDPTVLVNTRLGIHEVGDNGVDFETMADNEFPENKKSHTWETAATFNHSWGYNRDDQGWRSTTYFVREIVQSISKGGNVMLNIGPRADGSIPQEIKTRMEEIGKVIRTNKEGFYGTGPTPFSSELQDWGLITQRKDKNGTRLYLHVFEWSSDGIIRVNGLKNKVKSARILSLNKKVEVKQSGLLLHILGPVSEPCSYDSVIELVIEGDTQVENGFCGEINFGGIHSGIKTAKLSGGTAIISGEKLSPENWVASPSSIGKWEKEGAKAEWRIYVPEAGEKSLRICYACDSIAAGQFYKVTISDVGSIKAKTLPGPRGFKEFYTRHLGKVKFPHAGMYTVSVTPVGVPDRELFYLNWLFWE